MGNKNKPPKILPPLDQLHDLLGEDAPDKSKTRKLVESITKKSLISILEDYPNGGKEAMGKESIKKLGIRILEKTPSMNEEERADFRKLSEKLDKRSISIDQNKDVKEEFVTYAHEHPSNLFIDARAFNELLQNLVTYVRSTPSMRHYKLPQDKELLMSLRKYFGAKVEHGEWKGLTRLAAHIALFISSEIDRGELKSITDIIKKKSRLVKEAPEQLLFSGYFTATLKEALSNGKLFPLVLKEQTPRKSDKKKSKATQSTQTNNNPQDNDSKNAQGPSPVNGTPGDTIVIDRKTQKPEVVDIMTPDPVITEPDQNDIPQDPAQELEDIISPENVFQNVRHEITGSGIKIFRDNSPIAELFAVQIKGPGMEKFATIQTPFRMNSEKFELNLKKDGEYTIRLLELEKSEITEKLEPGEAYHDLSFNFTAEVTAIPNTDNGKDLLTDQQEKIDTMNNIAQETADAISSTFALSDDEGKDDKENTWNPAGAPIEVDEQTDAITGVGYKLLNNSLVIFREQIVPAKTIKVSVHPIGKKEDEMIVNMDFFGVRAHFDIDSTKDYRLSMIAYDEDGKQVGKEYTQVLPLAGKSSTSTPASTPPPTGGSHSTTPPPPGGEEDGGEDTDSTTPPEPEEVIEPLTDAEREVIKAEIALALAYPITKGQLKDLKRRYSKKYHTDPKNGNGDAEVMSYFNDLWDERSKSKSKLDLDKVDLRFVEGKDFVDVLVRCVNKIKSNISVSRVESECVLQKSTENFIPPERTTQLRLVLNAIIKHTSRAGILTTLIHGYTYTLTRDIDEALAAEIREDIRTGGTHTGTGGGAHGGGTRGGTHGGGARGGTGGTGHTAGGGGRTGGGTGGPTAPDEDVDEDFEAEGAEELMEFETDWTSHTMWEDAKITKTELELFAMSFYSALIDRRATASTENALRYEEAINIIKHNGINNLYRLKTLLGSGISVPPSISTRFTRILKIVEDSQTSKAIKHINKIHKTTKYNDIYSRWFDSERFTRAEEQYKNTIKSLLMDEKLVESEFGSAFLGQFARLIANPDYRTEEAAEDALNNYFVNRKKHYYTKFGARESTLNGNNVEEFFQQREEKNAEKVMRPWMSSYEEFWINKKAEIEAKRPATRWDVQYWKGRYKASVLLNEVKGWVGAKQEKKDVLDKKIRQSESFEVFKGTQTATTSYSAETTIETQITGTELIMDEHGIPVYTLKGTTGFADKTYTLPIRESYRLERMLVRIINDTTLSDQQKKVACYGFVNGCIKLAMSKIGDLRGTINGKNITVSSPLMSARVIVDGETIIDNNTLANIKDLNYNDLMEKLINVFGLFRQVLVEKTKFQKEALKSIDFNDFKLSKAHKKLKDENETIWMEEVKEGETTREVWHIPQPDEESLHCFRIMQSGGKDIYYGNGKFYIVRGVGAARRVVQPESMQDLLKEINEKERNTFIPSFGKNFVRNYLQARESHDAHIFFNMNGSHYDVHLNEAGEVITDIIVDTHNELKGIYDHTKLESGSSDDKTRVKKNLANYEEQKQRVYNSQKDRGIAIMDYRQVQMKRSKWYKKADESITYIRNNEDLALTPVDTTTYDSFYNDIEFVQQLVKLADKTIK